MKKVTFAALAALTITACSSGPKFQVNGDVSGADGKMLYLEASGLEGIVPLDSVKLKGEGTFSFKQPRPESPEFYRLRIDDKIINFSVDSIETIQIKAPYVDFSTTYTVEGSENSNKIKELTLKQIRLQKRWTTCWQLYAVTEWGMMYLKTVWQRCSTITRKMSK